MRFRLWWQIWAAAVCVLAIGDAVWEIAGIGALGQAPTREVIVADAAAIIALAAVLLGVVWGVRRG